VAASACVTATSSHLAGDYIQAVRQRIEGRGLALVFEPGRSIVANAGVLLTRVEYLKHTAHKDFAIVDAAMNDLIRPALYQAWMNVIAVQPHEGDTRRYDMSDRSAKPATSSPRIVSWRWSRATCWRCVRPVPTASS